MSERGERVGYPVQHENGLIILGFITAQDSH